MKEYHIALLEGDGIGPEVIREGRKVLEAAARAGALRLLFLLEGEDGRPLRVSGPLRLLDHGRLVIEEIRPDGKEKDD